MKIKGILIISILLMACNTSSQKEEIDSSGITFFDMKAYFEDEIKNFKFKTLKKTASLNDKSETKTITDFDISEELELFSKANINRPAWKDKYKVEETANKVTYTAADEELNIKSIIIEKNGDEVSKITIQSASKNSLLEAEKLMIYEPKKGYSIKNRQSVTLSGDNTMHVEVEFI